MNRLREDGGVSDQTLFGSKIEPAKEENSSGVHAQDQAWEK